MYVAVVIRYALEDFHGRHLSNAQMRELNPIIRNAVATALHALRHSDDNAGARRYIDYHLSRIPKYWEPPELLHGYIDAWLDRPTFLPPGNESAQRNWKEFLRWRDQRER